MLQRSHSPKRLRVAVALLSIVAPLGMPQLLAAKPKGPVAIETSKPPAGMRSGDVADTAIRVSPSIELQRLEVTVYVIEGLELLSDQMHVVYENVKANEVKALTARVRLTNQKQGVLGIMAESVDVAGGKAIDVTSVTYGLQ